MAINFPNTPSNGDIFGNFTYDSSIPGWRKTPENAASLPAGTIVQWPGATAPANWLLADGSAVSRTTYASLFAAIGVQYGSGDGTTTFNLPNLKGRVAVGLDSSQTEFNTLGETGGAKTHTLTESELPSHTHIQNAHNHTFSGTTDGGGSHDHQINVSGTQLRYLNTNAAQSTGLGGLAGIAGGADNLRATAVGNHTHTYSGTTSSSTSTNQSTGGGGAHNNLQPYIVLNYIIKTSAGITSGDSELATRVGIVENQNNLTPMSYNYLINGAFDFWQRGTSATNNTGYLADRWAITQNGTGASTNQSRVTTTVQGRLGYALRVVAASSATSIVEWAVRQPIERGHMEALAGKTVTLSFWYRSNRTGTHGARIIGLGTGSSDVTSAFTVAVADTWQRYSITSSAAYGNITAWSTTNPTDIGTYIDIGFKAGNSGPGFSSLAANDYFEITGVQLEEGSYATPFRRNASSIQAELAACQRYFEIVGAIEGWMSWTGNGAKIYAYTYKVTKRVAPTSYTFASNTPSITVNDVDRMVTYFTNSSAPGALSASAEL